MVACAAPRISVTVRPPQRRHVARGTPPFRNIPLLGRLRDPSVHCAHTGVCECAACLRQTSDPSGSPKGGFPPEWPPLMGEEKTGLSGTVKIWGFVASTSGTSLTAVDSVCLDSIALLPTTAAVPYRRVTGCPKLRGTFGGIARRRERAGVNSSATGLALLCRVQ